MSAGLGECRLCYGMVLLLEFECDHVPYVCGDIRRRKEQLVGTTDDDEVFAGAERGAAG